MVGSRSAGLMSRELPNHVTYDMMHLMLPKPPRESKIDTCENISLPQLSLGVVTILEKLLYLAHNYNYI